MEELLDDSIGTRRVTLILLGSFAGLALLLAAVGIYGVMAYSVTQRTHEIGIRMALGAQRRDVLRQVVSVGMRLTLIGLAIGAALSLGLGSLLSSLLFGVKRQRSADICLRLAPAGRGRSRCRLHSGAASHAD